MLSQGSPPIAALPQPSEMTAHPANLGPRAVQAGNEGLGEAVQGHVTGSRHSTLPPRQARIGPPLVGRKDPPSAQNHAIQPRNVDVDLRLPCCQRPGQA